MDADHLDELKQSLGRLSPGEQDQLAGFLLVERLKRNSLVMPALHKRIDDSDPDNWQTWHKPEESKRDE
ncbi:MAG: hypothetical protein ACPH5P_05300 [Akkermansiaceae bacterium]